MTDPYRTPAEVPPEPPEHDEPKRSVFESPAQAFYESREPTLPERIAKIDHMIAETKALAAKTRAGSAFVRVRRAEIVAMLDSICDLATACKQLGEQVLATEKK